MIALIAGSLYIPLVEIERRDPSESRQQRHCVACGLNIDSIYATSDAAAVTTMTCGAPVNAACCRTAIIRADPLSPWDLNA